MSLNLLLKFREAYLRAIAQAWHDPKFKRRLLDHPAEALEDFGFCWPWRDICDLAMIDASSQTAWLCDAWVTSPGQIEMLRLHAPLVPRLAENAPEGPFRPLTPSPELMAMALADYYRQRAVLFSDQTQPHAQNAGQHSDHAGEVIRAAFSEQVGASVGLGSAFPLGGFTPAHNTFESFKVVLLAAIAEAWRSTEFKRMLEIDAATALRRIRNYRLPWGFRLVIADDPDTFWCPPRQTPDGIESGWRNCKNHRLTLVVPPPPDLTSQPVALAAYNAAGAAYPFTCCL